MKKITHFLFIIISLTIMMNACRKDESSDTDSSTTNNSDQVYATISGIVTDENNQPVIGAQVITGGLTTSTDHYGIFLLKGNVTKGRCVIRITKAGFLNRSHAFIPKESIVNYIRIVLDDEPVAQIISASTGGTVSLTSGGSIQFVANSFVIKGSSVPYTGTVNVVASHLAPGSANFGLMIPGGDLAGKNSSGDDVSLYSFGMTGATLKGSGGEDLQLAAGTTATITFPIAAGQQGIAPASIPLWYLDEETALWKEEGTATKVGNNYVGTVAHFSTWNCDYGGPRATINGRVVDCEGIPQANVIVTINGGVTVVTDANGYYTTWVPSGWALTFQVLPQGVIVLPSQLENVAPLTTGQTFTVPDLIVPCASYIIGNITDCNSQQGTGTAILLYNGIILNYFYITEGAFNFMAPGNATVTLEVASSAGLNSQSITSASINDSINLGNIQICNDATSSNSFIINGQAYNNVRVNIFNTTSNGANYIIASNTTEASVWGISNIGESSIHTYFTGNQSIAIDLNENFDSTFTISVADDFYYPSHAASDHFYINVTEYGNVGDTIRGSFNGKMINWSDTSKSLLVTDGKFAFLRGADQ